MMKLLVVDDHILFREGLVSLINRQDDLKVVGEAGSVAEAVQLAGEIQPDMVLMDFNLPDGTGLDATRTIIEMLPDTRIVFLTIYDDDERLISAVRLGAKGYLLKNIPVANLLSALRGLLRGEAALSRVMTSRILEEFSHSVHTTADLNSNNPMYQLTGRELEVLRAMVSNATNREIAERLFISENTVRNHVHNILEKLGVSSRREAIGIARRFGLEPTSPP
jgi:DNA-binding NarL/FixJ family response regulator